MIMIKLVEMENGFIVDMVDDESLMTFNECNVRRIASTFEEAVATVKKNYDKILAMRKESAKELEKREKEIAKNKPAKTRRPA